NSNAATWRNIDTLRLVSLAQGSGRAAERRERREVHVFETALRRLEAKVRLTVGEHVNDGATAEQPRRDHVVRGFVRFELALVDGLAPHPAGELRYEIERSTRAHDAPR